MDDMLARLMSGYGGAALEWVVVFSFVAFAIVYFLAPVLGYDGSHRGMIAISMYLLIGYGLLALLQLMISYLLSMGSRNFDSVGRTAMHMQFIFGILKMIVFLGAQGCFVFGLQSLRRDHVAR